MDFDMKLADVCPISCLEAGDVFILPDVCGIGMVVENFYDNFPDELAGILEKRLMDTPFTYINLEDGSVHHCEDIEVTRADLSGGVFTPRIYTL